MTVRELVDEYAAEDPELLQMVGFEDCVAGICVRFGQEPILIYDKQKVIAKLMAGGLDEEEAEEYFGFNQIGAWMGDRTPAFLIRPE
jgi:hypothetical protein